MVRWTALSDWLLCWNRVDDRSDESGRSSVYLTATLSENRDCAMAVGAYIKSVRCLDGWIGPIGHDMESKIIVSY